LRIITTEVGNLRRPVQRMAPLSRGGLASRDANLARAEEGSYPGILTGEDLAALSTGESGVGLHTPGVGLRSLQSGSC